MIALETATTPGFCGQDGGTSSIGLSMPSERAVTAGSTTVADGPRLPWERAGGPAAGGMLGPYRLLERLGQGSQGEVWRAIATGDPRGVEIALKILPPGLARDPRRRAQFRHEAERGARVGGRALLPTRTFGEADGLPFLAMPLIDGGSLAEVIAWRRRPGPRPPHRLATADEDSYRHHVVRIVARIARDLARAHDASVVHRDIKPANILLERRRDDAGYLCDFGLGRDLDIATPAQLRDGAGTPLYMAPERLLRRPADEIKCDIYALGATLFEALALVPPIPIPEGMPCAEWPEFLTTARLAPPGAFRPGIPPDLDAAVLRALDRQPSRRFATARDFARALTRSVAWCWF